MKSTRTQVLPLSGITQGNITLVPLNRWNWTQFAYLKTSKKQADIISPNMFMIARGQYATDWQSIGIYAKDKPVGMMVVEWNLDAQFHRIIELMIAESDQRKGYATAALCLLVKEVVRQKKSHEIVIMHHPGNIAAESCYRKAGFKPCGKQGSMSVLRVKLHGYDYPRFHKKYHTQKNISVPTNLRFDWPREAVQANGKESAKALEFNFKEFGWPSYYRKLLVPQCWKGAKHLRIRLTLNRKAEDIKAQPIPVRLYLEGILLQCGNENITVDSGTSEHVIPFINGGWKWTGWRATDPALGDFKLSKLGPIKWITLMLWGWKRTDAGVLRVDSIRVE